MKRRVLVESLNEFFNSKEGQRLINKAVNKALIRELTLEMHRDENGNPIVPPKVKQQKVNVVDQLVIYLSRTEGAIRGFQTDLEKERVNTTKILGQFEKAQEQFVLAMKKVLTGISSLTDTGAKENIKKLEGG